MNPGELGVQGGSANGHAASISFVTGEPLFSRIRVGMVCLLTSEAVFFSALIVTYLTYLGHDTTGPTPNQVLRLPLVIVNTACLLTSSLTMVLAVRALQQGRRLSHGLWLIATMLLALAFLGGTAWEWRHMIVHDGLLPSTNLFGSTFYTLVGFHGLHVTVGVIAMAIVLGLVVFGRAGREQNEGVEMVSWYWHLVDGVWVVIFSIVYLYGR